MCGNTPAQAPVSSSQMRAVLSSDAVTTKDPSSATAAELMMSPWPACSVRPYPQGLMRIQAR